MIDSSDVSKKAKVIARGALYFLPWVMFLITLGLPAAFNQFWPRRKIDRDEEMIELSNDTQEMLSVVDKYEQGEVNLEEAIAEISQYAQLDDKTIRGILRGVERENIIEFPKPQTKEAQSEKSKSWKSDIVSCLLHFALFNLNNWIALNKNLKKI